jgi:putative glutamine amidotransferase
VVNGGTLYGDVQKEKRSQRAHIDLENYDTYRHPVSVVPGTPLAQWYRRKTLNVNSYHHQGIRELALRFRPMAHADDGLIEAFYDPEAAFMVGLQFHPERMLKEYSGNLKVWKAFAAAAADKRRR